MILSDRAIKAAIHQGTILIDPPPTTAQYNTTALDLLLGEPLFRLKTPREFAHERPAAPQRSMVVSLAEVPPLSLFLQQYAIPLVPEADGSFILPPQQFAVGMTRESVGLPTRARLAARVEGRSSLARLGLAVHLTAPTIHAGFHGPIVLEMFNFSPYHLRLVPGKVAICQLIFEKVSRTPSGTLNTKSGRRKRRR